MTEEALNRIADALFAMADSNQESVELQRRHLEAQEASLRVTAQLEQHLMLRSADDRSAN